MGSVTRRRLMVTVLAAAALLVTTLPPILDPLGSAELPGAAAETLPPIDPLAPTEHGASPVDGLQYADPTEALVLIDPPEANSDGSAEVAYPIDVPPGHGITPELAVSYSSSGDNGWLGHRRRRDRR